VELQRGKLGRHEVLCGSNVVDAGASSHGELRRVRQTRIEECSGSMHVEVRNERIPVRHTAPAGVGVLIHTSEARRRGNEYRRRTAVGTECLPVEKQLCVELAWSPAVENRPYRRLINLQPA